MSEGDGAGSNGKVTVDDDGAFVDDDWAWADGGCGLVGNGHAGCTEGAV